MHPGFQLTAIWLQSICSQHRCFSGYRSEQSLKVVKSSYRVCSTRSKCFSFNELEYNTKYQSPMHLVSVVYTAFFPLHLEACRISSSWQRVKPSPLQGKHTVLTTGPPRKCHLHSFLTVCWVSPYKMYFLQYKFTWLDLEKSFLKQFLETL